jgi:hypothetical protein
MSASTERLRSNRTGKYTHQFCEIHELESQIDQSQDLFRENFDRLHGTDKQAYTVADIAELTGLSAGTVTRMFEHERGVIILERPERMHKRKYRSIRIPRVVYERVIGRLTVR